MATRNIKRILDIEVRDYARHVKNGVENRFHLAKPRYKDKYANTRTRKGLVYYKIKNW